MLGRLLIFLIALPFLEIWLLIKLGGVIGAAATIGLIILTTIVGTQLVRLQGFHVMREIQSYQQRDETPTIPMLESGALLLAGACLIVPGLITDTLGFLLLIPPLRKFCAHRLLKNMIVVDGSGNSSPPPGAPPHVDHDTHTVEGRFHRED